MSTDTPQGNIDIQAPGGVESESAAESDARESEPFDAAANDGSADGSGRFRSTIEFPYQSLKDAEQVASELHHKWAGSASPDQIAAGLNSTTKSGAFRLKIAAARLFGLVDVSRGNVSLTNLGRQIIDPQTRDGARSEAFLRVRLFRAIFDDFKSSLLPPDAALEKKMMGLGVSPKQASRARQAFQRSAEHAGFFRHGRTRLVQPATSFRDPQEPSDFADAHKDEPVDVKPLQDQPATSAGPVPAPVQALWVTLLQDGHSWSAEKTQEFVETARKLHELLAKNG